MAKYDVAIGEEFSIGGVEIDDIDSVERLAAIDDRRRLSRHQARLTYGVLGVFVVAMAVSVLMGWRDGTYNELTGVWSAGGFWVGLVLGRYFKRD